MCKKKSVVRPKCPKCGSRNVAYIIWGFYMPSDKIEAKIKRGELVLAGCNVSVLSERWLCNDCEYAFGNIGIKPIMMNALKEPKVDFIHAITATNDNFDVIQSSQKCGCYKCGRIFAPHEITEWVDDINLMPDDSPNIKTALCPYCDSDTVLGDAAGYPLTENFFAMMRDYWENITLDEG